MDTKLEVRNVFLKTIESLSNEYQGSSLTDIFILIDEESGELSVYDDEENLIVKEIIKEWEIAASEDKDVNYIRTLRAVIEKMDDEDLFSVLDIYTPFSISLADENFIVQEELLTIEDDSVIRLESDFMKRMDKEFDEFLEKLLKE